MGDGQPSEMPPVTDGSAVSFADQPHRWFCVEPMTRFDLSEVVAIERMSFKDPWSRASFEAEMEKPYAGLKVARLEAEDSVRPIAGYICFWLVVDELQITNIAVHPCYRRRGLGKHLLFEALHWGCQIGARSALLEVDSSNGSAQALYEKFGFVPLHRRPGYYPESNEDGLVMGLSLEQW